MKVFINFFAKCDHEVHQKNQVRTLQNSGYHSTANMMDATTLEERIIEQFNKQIRMKMANRAATIEDLIYNAEENDTPVPPTCARPTAIAYTAIAANSKTEQLLALLKAVDTRPQKIESGRRPLQGS